MGVENYLITSSLVAVLAQRLVRVICPGCKAFAGEVLSPEGEMVDTWRGEGCASCNGRGYHARMGIFEMMDRERRNPQADHGKCGRQHTDARGAQERHAESARRRLAEDPRRRESVEEVMRVTQEF